MKGVTAAATGAIAGAVIVLARRSVHDTTTAVIAGTVLLLLSQWKVPEPLLIAVAGAIGLAVYHG